MCRSRRCCCSMAQGSEADLWPGRMLCRQNELVTQQEVPNLLCKPVKPAAGFQQNLTVEISAQLFQYEVSPAAVHGSIGSGYARTYPFRSLSEYTTRRPSQHQHAARERLMPTRPSLHSVSRMRCMQVRLPLLQAVCNTEQLQSALARWGRVC